jgi:hypothetical protein
MDPERSHALLFGVVWVVTGLVSLFVGARKALRAYESRLAALTEAARDAARHPVHSDTCGVCGKHFEECEEGFEIGTGPKPKPGCAGAQLRAALEGR